MASVNKIMLIGNLTRDPEMRYATSGTAVCNFGLAMNHKYGEKEEVCFLDVTAFGKLAEVAGQYLAKGRQTYVEGRVQHQTWEKDGQRHSKHVVIAERIQFLGRNDHVLETGSAAGAGPQRGLDDDGDIPF